MKTIAFLSGLVALAQGKVYFSEKFEEGWKDRWVVSDWKQDSGEAGEWKASAGEFYADAEDLGLQTSQDARFYAISSKFDETFNNEGKDLVMQFSIKHPQKLDCGGGYIKLLRPDLDQANFNGDAEYAIMFGPDICGAKKIVHTIFSHPETNENLLKTKEVRCEGDQLNHIYTLIIKPDDTYQIKIDGEEKASGSLYDDWEFRAAKEIKDPDQSKPEDWVDDKFMDDPEDEKPEGYDDIPEKIADPDAVMPEDWDEEADGEWEAPEIPNPDFKGPWRPRKIENPEYKGAWEHPMIPNPDYVEHTEVYKRGDMGAVGIELWQVKSGTIFDNIIITDSEEEAQKFAEETWPEASAKAEKEMFDKKQEEKRKAEEAEREAARKLAEEQAAEEEDEESESLDEDDEDLKEEL